MTTIRRKIAAVDILVLGIFLAFSLWYLLGRLQANFPNPILSGDGGNLVSFAAAQDQPGLFRGDPALGEANLTGYYATIHIPLIKALSRLTGGDYSVAFLLTLAPTLLIQLLGFYILGRVLFDNRFYAFLLAVLTAMPFTWSGLGEFWGVWPDPLPRVTYQAVLPYLLALVVLWRRQPRRWPWLMVFAGLMVFLHSISTPAIGFAIWLGLWMYLPGAWKPLKKLGVMLGLGLLFLLALSPFAINFLSFNARGASPNYELVMSIIQTYLPPYLLNTPAALSLFATRAVFELLLPLAVVGFYLLWRFGKAERALVVMVLTWFSAVLLISVGLPVVERLVENALHRLPVDTELARGMRYLVPLLLIFWLWPLAELSRRWSGRWAARGLAIVGLVLVGGWTASHPPQGERLLQAAGCISAGQAGVQSGRGIQPADHRPAAHRPRFAGLVCQRQLAGRQPDPGGALPGPAPAGLYPARQRAVCLYQPALSGAVDGHYPAGRGDPGHGKSARAHAGADPAGARVQGRLPGHRFSLPAG